MEPLNKLKPIQVLTDDNVILLKKLVIVLSDLDPAYYSDEDISYIKGKLIALINELDN